MQSVREATNETVFAKNDFLVPPIRVLDDIGELAEHVLVHGIGEPSPPEHLYGMLAGKLITNRDDREIQTLLGVGIGHENARVDCEARNGLGLTDDVQLEIELQGQMLRKLRVRQDVMVGKEQP